MPCQTITPPKDFYKFILISCTIIALIITTNVILATTTQTHDLDKKSYLHTQVLPTRHHSTLLSNPELCPPLPPASSPIINISDEASMRLYANSAAAGTTLVIQPGTYQMNDFLHISQNGITLRGATNNRHDVILDFGGMTNGHFGILVEANDVTIANLTIQNATDHGVAINGGDRPFLYNLDIHDIGDQLVKVNPIGDGSDDGVLACSHLYYTNTAPDNYTNGISAHNAHNWVIRDNLWERIRTPDNTPVPTILFWSGSTGTVVERNVLIDCYQGISFGNPSHEAGDHSGGVVRNNFIYASQPHDVVIEMIHATDCIVANNTALLLNPVAGLTWGMEARFPDTSGLFVNNLTNMSILPNRDSAQATMQNNITNAVIGWFVSPLSGDLHLTNQATSAIDNGLSLALVADDIDGQFRPIGVAPDIGADEYGASPSPTPTVDPSTLPYHIYLPVISIPQH